MVLAVLTMIFAVISGHVLGQTKFRGLELQDTSSNKRFEYNSGSYFRMYDSSAVEKGYLYAATGTFVGYGSSLFATSSARTNGVAAVSGSAPVPPSDGIYSSTMSGVILNAGVRGSASPAIVLKDSVGSVQPYISMHKTGSTAQITINSTAKATMRPALVVGDLDEDYENILFGEVEGIHTKYGLFQGDLHTLDTLYASEGVVVGQGRQDHSQDGSLWIESVGSGGVPTWGNQEMQVETDEYGTHFRHNHGFNKGHLGTAFDFDSELHVQDDIRSSGTVHATAFIGDGSGLTGIGGGGGDVYLANNNVFTGTNSFSSNPTTFQGLTVTGTNGSGFQTTQFRPNAGARSLFAQFVPNGAGRALFQAFNSDFAADSTNYQVLEFGYNLARTSAIVKSLANGSLSRLPLVFSADNTDTQMILKTDGTTAYNDSVGLSGVNEAWGSTLAFRPTNSDPLFARFIPNGNNRALFQAFNSDFTADSTNYQVVEMGYNAARTHAAFHSLAAGSLSRLPISIAANGTDTQFVANTDGSLSWTGNVSISLAGSSTASPRTIGPSSYPAGFAFKLFDTLQGAENSRVQLGGYYGLDLFGLRELDGMPHTAGNLTSDAHVNVHGRRTGNVILDVRAAASHTANLQTWTSSAGSVLASVSSAGVFTGSGTGLSGVAKLASANEYTNRQTITHATLPNLYLRTVNGDVGLGTVINDSYYIKIGGGGYNAGSYRLIGFGYTNAVGNQPPAFIGYKETNSGGQTAGDLVFGTRNSTSLVDPSIRLTISAAGDATFTGTVQAADYKSGAGNLGISGGEWVFFDANSGHNIGLVFEDGLLIQATDYGP